MHPLGIVWLLLIQWYALIRQVAGKPASWKGRDYAGGITEQEPVLTHGS